MITHERLKEVLSYNKSTGLFRWKKQLNARGVKGAVAGANSFSSGYRIVSIDCKQYRAARLAWFYVHGEWPKHVIDHINGVRHDDRICNLRDVTQLTNTQNFREPMSNNQSGYLGVDWKKDKQKWRAQIRTNGKKVCIGYFATAELAHQAYVEAKRQHHEGSIL